MPPDVQNQTRKSKLSPPLVHSCIHVCLCTISRLSSLVQLHGLFYALIFTVAAAQYVHSTSAYKTRVGFGNYKKLLFLP